MWHFAAQAHLAQMLQMQEECFRERWDAVVAHAVLLAHLLHDGRDGWVVILRHAWEEVVYGLVVQGSAQEGHDGVTMRVVHGRLHLSGKANT